MRGKPNFLFIMTDQQRADHLGCAGNRVLKTPNIDRIAERGTLFGRYYASSPICMPVRATLATGRMPSAHRVRGNGMPLSTDATTLMDLMRADGYRTALIGKLHLQNMMSEGPLEPRPPRDPGNTEPPAHLSEARKAHIGEGPYDQELESRWVGDPAHDVRLPYYGFDHVELCINHGDLVHGHYGRWLEGRHADPASLRGPRNALPAEIVAPDAWRTRMPAELYPTTYVADRTIAYLEQHAERGSDAPFFLQCSFPDPHHPFTPPGRYWDLYRPEDVELPPSFQQGRDDAPPTVRHARQLLERGDRDIGVGFALAVTEAEARQAIALTYGMIAFIDDAVGRILDRLEALGLADNTIIVFTSDHGDFMGDHRLLLKGPIHYRGVVNIPFIWADPHVDGQPPRCDRLCSSLDFVPTVLDRAGLAPFHGVQGKSLTKLLAGQDEPVWDSVLIEEENQRLLFGFKAPPRIRSLVTGDWRLSIYDGVPWGELYDLRNDPHEMRNLWDDSRHAAQRARMLEGLARKMMELADRAPFPTMRA